MTLPEPRPEPTTGADPNENVEASTEAEPRAEIRVVASALTDVGQLREHNEDNYLVADLTGSVRHMASGNYPFVLGARGAICAVCDGMGGAAAGEIASQLAVDTLFNRMSQALDDATSPDRNVIARELVKSVEAAGQRIYNEARLDRSRRGMGTTVTAAALADDVLFVAQVGDSRAYVLRGGGIVQVTRDQSLVNQLIEAGQLTEQEAETFEHNNIILQALGTSDGVQVDLTFVELRRGDVLLLCSDGLSGMLKNDELRELLSREPDPYRSAQVLVDEANRAGGHDNITAVVLRFEGEGLAPPSEGDEGVRYRKYLLPQSDEPTTLAGSLRAYTGKDGEGGGRDSEGIIRIDTGGDLSFRDREPEGDESIEIPGTHVPAWVIIFLMAAVLLVLTAGAFALMR